MAVINWTLLATSALGFTAALAVNEAVKDTIHAAVPPTSRRAIVGGSIVYAVVVLLLVLVVATVWNATHRVVNGSAGGRAPGGGAPPRDHYAPGVLVRLAGHPHAAAHLPVH